MRRSDKKLLAGHIGKVPNIVELDKAAPDYAAKLEQAVAAVVEKQRSLGIDIMNENECAKGGDWLSYLEDRFGGFEPRAARPSAEHLLAQGKDRDDFAEFYRYPTDEGTLFYEPAGLSAGCGRAGSAPRRSPTRPKRRSRARSRCWRKR